MKPKGKVRRYEPLTGSRMEEGYKDPRWFKKRDKILTRGGYCCAICGSKLKTQVHHKYYKSKNPVWDYPDLSLISLCETHHKRVHEIKDALHDDYSGDLSFELLQEEYWLETHKDEKGIEVGEDVSTDNVKVQGPKKPLKVTLYRTQK